MNFVEKLIKQPHVDIESLFLDEVDEWNNDESNTQLHEFLGLTWEEYRLLVQGELNAETLIKLRCNI